MADWLLVRLQGEAGASWMVADTGGRMVTQPESGTLEQAAALAPGKRVCALVPGADVLLVDADVPLKGNAKIQQVVPFALEEQLADDIEDLHFAVGKRPSDSLKTPVAVVARSLMDAWLGSLHAAGLRPEVIYADSAMIPTNPGQAVALLEGDTVAVRPAGGALVSMPLDALGEALEMARAPVDEITAERSGRGLILYTGPAEWQEHSAQVESLRDRFDGIKVQLMTAGPLVLFAQQLPNTTAINLLQASYAPAHSFAASWKNWRIAAALLVGLIVLHTAGRGVELMTLKKTEKQLDASIIEAFRVAMPGEQSTVDARRRMEQKLLAVSGGGAGNGLLTALDALAQAKNAAPGTVVQALTFREGSLDLKLAAPDAGSLDRISQSLRSGGWQADLTSGNAVASGYEGRIQIKPKGS